MGKRAERKKRADSKRSKYKGLICYAIQQDIKKRMRQGFSERAAVSDGLAEADVLINKLIKKCPGDAHLIRQSAYQFKREIQEAIKNN